MFIRRKLFFDEGSSSFLGLPSDKTASAPKPPEPPTNEEQAPVEEEPPEGVYQPEKEEEPGIGATQEEETQEEEEPEATDAEKFQAKFQTKYQDTIKFIKEAGLYDVYREMGNIPPEEESYEQKAETTEPEKREAAPGDYYDEDGNLIPDKFMQAIIAGVRGELDGREREQLKQKQVETYRGEVRSVNENYQQFITDENGQQMYDDELLKSAWEAIQPLAHDPTKPGGPTKNLHLFVNEMRWRLNEKDFDRVAMRRAADEVAKVKQVEAAMQPGASTGSPTGAKSKKMQHLEESKQREHGGVGSFIDLAKQSS